MRANAQSRASKGLSNKFQIVIYADAAWLVSGIYLNNGWCTDEETYCCPYTINKSNFVHFVLKKCTIQFADYKTPGAAEHIVNLIFP